MTRARIAALGIALGIVGCDGPASPPNTNVPLNHPGSGEVTGMTRWQSAPWDPAIGEPWLRLNGGSRLTIAHPLGRVPANVSVYLSFFADGQLPAPSAGDTAILEEVTDDHVTLRNRTAQALYVRIVLD